MPAEGNLHVLFEHAAGFAAFKVREFEEESMFMAEVSETVRDYSRFKAVVQLVGFSPFKTAHAALENLNAITEGILPDDLKTFLVTLGVKKLSLGVAEGKLASAIAECFPKIQIRVGTLVQELMRGIRTHFYKMVKGLTGEAGSKSQLGLGHAYSRSKVKFNVNRADNMIIQGIALLDQLDKDVNTFSMRIREWYSYHFPELAKIVTDNYTYARVVHYIKNRKQLDVSKLPELEEVIGDSWKAQAVLDASKSSMGMDISPIDLINIERFASRVMKLAEYRQGLFSYLQSKMNAVAPNLTTLLGETVAARLISHAGSLTNLAKFPASTVQILGAEKALFRALKTRGKTPKYGLLFHSTFIGRAAPANKGRISRFLANKCSIASRIDCFTETPNSIFGGMLREQVEERLKFYDSGEVPRKNSDCMADALNESQLLSVSMLAEMGLDDDDDDEEEVKNKKDKRKKKIKVEVKEEEEPLKKKKKVKEEAEKALPIPEPSKTKKKKKVKTEPEEVLPEPAKKKRKTKA